MPSPSFTCSLDFVVLEVKNLGHSDLDGLKRTEVQN